MYIDPEKKNRSTLFGFVLLPSLVLAFVIPTACRSHLGWIFTLIVVAICIFIFARAGGK